MATTLIAVTMSVLLAALVVLVAVLLARTRRLDREVAQLRAAVPPRPPAPQSSVKAAPAGHRGQSEVVEDDGAVTVITRLVDGPLSQRDEPTLARVVSVTAARPVIKLVALAHGVHRALGEDSRMRIGYAFRRELRRQRRLLRQQGARAPRPPGPGR